ncbi:uncharacterized protein FTOL_13852 [Fusarium torulosum]|uniref:Uncharacterized protein n=1 Tax=Fusarium torulosum TaxID=33205 RepID=A0AAE8MPA8_9HYPO|nr:uncharacterized protein FTOL_13852 [Fusarium torulosum]
MVTGRSRGMKQLLMPNDDDEPDKTVSDHNHTPKVA